jgi:HPt (histidine-containing phosphotransfer) domain-containing protein
MTPHDPMDPEDCIDSAALDRLRRVGQDKLVKQMIDIYFDYAPKMLHNALAGEQAGDCTAIEHAMHSLKSSAGHIGASAVHDLARRLESLARNKEFDSIGPLLRELEIAFEKARLRLVELKPA